MKFWQCTVCKYIHEGDAPPEKCPICGVDSSKFIEIDEASIPKKAAKKAPPKKSSPIADDDSGTSKTEGEKTPSEPIKKLSKYEHLTAFLLKHHAHPVSVHAPNGILPAAVLLLFIAWLLEIPLLEKAAIINLVIVILTLPFVVYTGILEWKTKYNGAMTGIFKIKIFAASITCISCAISLGWYLIDPQVLSTPRAWAFLLMNVIMISGAGVAGLIGGRLVFKD